MAISCIEWIGDYPFITWDEEWERWEDCASNYPSERYALGLIEPNYPMPAIPIHVEWNYCWCLGQRTKMHVLYWKWLGNSLGWVSTKAISAE